MNRNQRRMAAYNASKAAQKIETANYTAKISKAFSKLSGEATERVAKAMAITLPRDSVKPVVEKQKREWHNKPAREMGITCSGRQKTKGKSIALI
jgi:acetyl-CoA carboxylase alpha subunit